MVAVKRAAQEFLAHRRVAVTGVSREPGSHGANVVYRRLKERGYDVFAVNPSTDSVEGDPSYPDLGAIPGGVEAVVIGTRPERAQATVEQCVALGVEHVWMHHSVDGSSVSADATRYAREHGLTVIDGGCPLMFAPVSDPGHAVMKAFCRMTHALPREV